MRTMTAFGVSGQDAVAEFLAGAPKLEAIGARQEREILLRPIRTQYPMLREDYLASLTSVQLADWERRAMRRIERRRATERAFRPAGRR